MNPEAETGKKVKKSLKTSSTNPSEEKTPLDVLNGELDAVMERCKKNNYTLAERRAIFSPVIVYLNQHKGWFSSKPIRFYLLTGACAVFVIILACFMSLFYHEYLSGWGAFYYNAIAYGIIPKDALVYYFGDGCIISNPFYVPPPPYTPAPEDCFLCESINSVDILENVTYDHLKANYLDRGRPLIVLDVEDSMKANMTVGKVAEIFLSPNLSSIPPCYLDSNLQLRSLLDMREFLKIQKLISQGKLDKWFIQWKNCKMEAVRKLRSVYKRLKFWDPSVNPEHASWVLMSANHSGRAYKTFNTVTHNIVRLRAIILLISSSLSTYPMTILYKFDAQKQLFLVTEFFVILTFYYYNCLMSEILEWANDRLRLSVYQSRWYCLCPAAQRMVVMFLRRSQRPYYIRTLGGMVTLGNINFLKTLKSVYSFIRFVNLQKLY